MIKIIIYCFLGSILGDITYDIGCYIKEKYKQNK